MGEPGQTGHDESAAHRGSFCVALAALLLAAMVCGCGSGSGQGLTENGTLPPPPGGDGGGTGGGGNGGGATSGNPNATLDWVQNNVFGGVCSQCHTGAGAPLGVNWSSSANTCSNIGRSSGEMPSMFEINSGDPSVSYVIWKVQGQGPAGQSIVGSQMPLSNPPLSDETIQNMRDWISDGTPGCQSSVQAAGSGGTVSKLASGTATAVSGGAPVPTSSWPLVWRAALQDCGVCHSLDPVHPDCQLGLACPPAGLVLGEGDYELVVNGYTVVPFNPAASSLWQALTRSDATRRMPLGLAPLSQAQLELILEWIRDGAPYCPEGDTCR